MPREKESWMHGLDEEGMMDQKFKAAWVEHLHMDRYTHCTGANRDTSKKDCYCACGVLMEIVREHLNEFEHDGEEYYKWDKTHEGGDEKFHMYRPFPSGGCIPGEICRFVGMSQCPNLYWDKPGDAGVVKKQGWNNLCTLNDSYRIPFRDMARAIMRTL